MNKYDNHDILDSQIHYHTMYDYETPIFTFSYEIIVYPYHVYIDCLRCQTFRLI